MLEILQFYVSGFWVWLGLTIALVISLSIILSILAAFLSVNRK